MKPTKFISSLFAVGLAVSLPSAVLAHAGHGDEFQSEGGIERVQVKAETDQILGIVVEEIAPTPDGSASVMIPAIALVNADGQQLVFVKHNDFYEPVKVTTGKTQGELVEITQGLTAGENLVTQGGLSLYAESKKTSSRSEPVKATSSEDAHAQADAKGIPHSHDDAGNLVESHHDFPVGLLAAIVGGAVLLVGGVGTIVANQRKDKSEPSPSEKVVEKVKS